MLLKNFKYKPLPTTQLNFANFRDDYGIDFSNIFKTIFCSMLDTEIDYPDPDVKHSFSCPSYNSFVSPYTTFGKFFVSTSSFNITIDMITSGHRRINDGFEKYNNDVYSIRHFPMAIETYGECFGNYHICVRIRNLFHWYATLILFFDEDGDYLPLFLNNTEDTSYIDKGGLGLTYKYNTNMELKNIEDMLIPELSNYVTGIYAFWLDANNICFVRANTGMFNLGGFGMMNSIIKVITRRDILTYEDDESKESFLKKFIYDRLPSDRLYRFSESFDLRTDDFNPTDIQNSTFWYNREFYGNLNDIQKYTYDNELFKKSVDIFRIVNSDVERFRKKVMFPESIKKIAEALSPLVIANTQLIRSSSVGKMEEI